MTASVAAALGIGVACAALARLVVPPTPRLAARVRPYTVVARSSLGRSPDVLTAPVVESGGTWRRLFGPPVLAAISRLGRLIEGSSDEQLARRLHQAGVHDVAPEEYRLRRVGQGAAGAVAFGLAAAVLLRAPLAVLAMSATGFAYGSSRARARLDRAIAARAARLRQELYTVNQLLALHIRTGAGPIQAIQRLVDRGSGAVVEELEAVLTWTRAGMREPDAFRHAAELTAEPSVARTLQLLAAGAERGADLADALRAFSDDIRDTRAEELHQSAVKRRAAMLVPTIAILAPIMLLFVAAPLPSIVLGHR